MIKKTIALLLALLLAAPLVVWSETTPYGSTPQVALPKVGKPGWGPATNQAFEDIVDYLAVEHTPSGGHQGTPSVDQWIAVTGPVTWLSTSSFKVPETSVFEEGRKVFVNQAVDVIGIVDSAITAAGETTVTLNKIVQYSDYPATTTTITNPITSVSVGVTTPRSAPAQSSTGPAYQNLMIANNTTNPTYQVDITADFITVHDGTQFVTIATVAKTCDITASGANGLDTGTEGNSTWYYIYTIYNGTTAACLLSTSATAPTMPSGYTFKKRVGAVYNDSSGDFLPILQNGNVASFLARQLYVSGGTAGSYTLVSPNLPSTTRLVFAEILCGTAASSFNISSDGVNLYAEADFGTSAVEHKHLYIPLTSGQQHYYQRVSGSGTFTANTLGYIDNI